MSEAPPTSHGEALRRWLDVAGARVVDIGCGDGGLCRRLARAGASAIIGVEISPDKVAAARAHEAVGPETYALGRGEALPLSEATVDVAIFFNSLHHAPEAVMGAALMEAARVVAPGGRLYVAEPLAQGPWAELVRPVVDETAMRAAADRALEAPAFRTVFALELDETYETVFDVADFAALKAGLIGVDPARAARLAAHEPALAAAFPSAGLPAPNGARRFTYKTRARRYARREAAE